MKPIAAKLLSAISAHASLLAAAPNAPATLAGRWQPTMESLAAHLAPEWLLDAKLGVQYVGEPLGMDDDKPN